MTLSTISGYRVCFNSRDAVALMEEQSPSTAVRLTAHLISSLPEADVRVDPDACRDAANFIHTIVQDRKHTAATISASWLKSNNLHPPEPSPHALKWFVLRTDIQRLL